MEQSSEAFDQVLPAPGERAAVAKKSLPAQSWLRRLRPRLVQAEVPAEVPAKKTAAAKTPKFESWLRRLRPKKSIQSIDCS